MARILVIDDNEQICTFLAKALGQDGHEVWTARHGDEGIARFREASAEVVITDIFMPEKDGLETVRELRRLSTEVRIIAISGGCSTGLEYLDAAALFGAARTLVKPFLASDICRAVREVLESWRLPNPTRIRPQRSRSRLRP